MSSTIWTSSLWPCSTVSRSNSRSATVLQSPLVTGRRYRAREGRGRAGSDRDPEREEEESPIENNRHNRNRVVAENRRSKPVRHPTAIRLYSPKNTTRARESTTHSKSHRNHWKNKALKPIEKGWFCSQPALFDVNLIPF